MLVLVASGDILVDFWMVFKKPRIVFLKWFTSTDNPDITVMLDDTPDQLIAKKEM